MKKKILSLLFSSLLILQSGSFFSVKAGKNYKSANQIALESSRLEPPGLPRPGSAEIPEFIPRTKPAGAETPQLRPRPFSTWIIPIDRDTEESFRTPFLCADRLVWNKDLIRRFVNRELVYVHININAPKDSPWIIFRIPSGSYICYQAVLSSLEERDSVISEAKELQNIVPSNLGYLLSNLKNIAFDAAS